MPTKIGRRFSLGKATVNEFWIPFGDQFDRRVVVAMWKLQTLGDWETCFGGTHSLSTFYTCYITSCRFYMVLCVGFIMIYWFCCIRIYPNCITRLREPGPSPKARCEAGPWQPGNVATWQRGARWKCCEGDDQCSGSGKRRWRGLWRICSFLFLNCVSNLFQTSLVYSRKDSIESILMLKGIHVNCL